jgi:hypothetical protein
MMGIFNSLLMNAGFALMSMSPEKSATFFLLGQTMTSVVVWPAIIALRAVIAAMGGRDQTDYIVACVSLTFAGLVTMGALPLYKYKTRHHSVFSHLIGPCSSWTIITPLSGNPILVVLKAVFIPALASWLCGVFTFAVFPSQVSLWVPFQGADAPYQAPLFRSFLIYMYSVADTFGRALPRIWSTLQLLSDRAFMIGTVLRGLVFVPLTLLSSSKIADALTYDWFRLLLLLAFGAANGANFALANMFGPRRVEACDKMTVGTILSFSAINGLLVGSLIGIGLKGLFGN